MTRTSLSFATVGGRALKENIATRVEALAAPVAENLGYQLFDVEYVKEGPDFYLRLYITKEEGIAIEDCEAMSRAVDPLLDEADFIKDRYYLEVSSVGLDRPLKKEKDFLYFMGEKIEVKLFAAFEGSDYWVGKLLDYEDGQFSMETVKGVMTVGVKECRQIRPWIDFSEYKDEN